MRNPGPVPAMRAIIVISALAAVVAAFAGGYALGDHKPNYVKALRQAAQRLRGDAAPDLPGQWSPAEAGLGAGAPGGGLPVAGASGDGQPDAGLTAHQKVEVDKLLSLGYAAGSRPRPRHTGVTWHVPALAESGPLLLASGHAPEAALIDRDGEVLHRWHCDYARVRETDPGAFLAPQKDDATGCWRRVHLFPDGGLLAIFEGRALVKLDRDSRLLWAYPGHCHHDLDVDEDGRIWVLTREAGLSDRLGEGEPVLLDYFTRLSPQGVVEARIALLAALEASPYASLLDKAPAGGDVFHTNTLERLDGSLAPLSPLFKRGNILTSIRELNAIAILDPDREAIVWALTGQWVKQHQPTLLPSGRILLFDNLGHYGRSKVVEVDPFTQEIVWSYEDGPEHSLFSRTCGAAQRLPGGNTLIVESDNGRALEVTPDGRIAWEYRNPQRAGRNGELIAAILDMTALPADFPLAWLQGTRVAGR